ncbi:MAG TPA: hypothetical protein VFD04_03935 [Actinomycetes bacterium]|jgi:hypothetical protein|nr:hypothetical protein [Actinomycetes bacterium]
MAMTPAARGTRPRRPAGLAWALWALSMLGLASVAWLDQLLRLAGRPDLVRWTGLGAASAVVTVLSTATAGAIVAGRRPRHPVGWLLLAFGLLLTASWVAGGYLAYGLLARPGALPATGAAVVLYSALNVSGAPVPLLALALLLTPTGSLPSRRWRWVAAALVAATVGGVLGTPLDAKPLDPPLQAVTSPLALDLEAVPLPVRLAYDVAGGVVFAAFVLGIVAAAGSLVVRFWRAQGVERQQLRWVALAAALVPVAALVALTASLVGGPAAGAVINLVAGTVSWLVPLALAAAVLRYRLYDLDRIVSRTLAYALLTVLLGGGYAVVVLGLGQLLGQDSPLVVAAATLAVAAAFQPARRRVQQAMDRRFNRRSHDAARVIEAFGTRLRDQVDLDTLTAELLDAVRQTMQPTQAWLWLRPHPPR